MSQYTTGEMAKLCEVSVRTVQFYDKKHLLPPSELSEGGRRLYNEGDLEKLRLICVLKSLGLSLNAIKSILTSEAPERVLLLLLEEQTKHLDEEIKEQQKQRKAMEAIKKSLHSGELLSVKSISDIEAMMNGKKKLRKTHMTMLTVGILMDLLEVGTLLLWILKGIWWPFAATIPIVITCAALLVRMYYRGSAYICPQCNRKFRPRLRNFFFSRHTPKTRKLSCTLCDYQGWCVETYADDERK